MIVRLIGLAVVLLLISCSKVLEVTPYHQVSLVKNIGSDRMLIAEHSYHMIGLFKTADKKKKLGYYYTTTWNLRDLDLPKKSLKLEFNYQQQATVSKIKTKSIEFPYQASGKHIFRVLGNDYAKYGRILTWNMKLFQNKKLIAEDSSYLW